MPKSKPNEMFSPDFLTPNFRNKKYISEISVSVNGGINSLIDHLQVIMMKSGQFESIGE